MDTLNVENWDTKLELMAEEASKRTIGYVAGIPGSIVSFFETAKETLPRSEYERMCSGVEVILTSGVNYRPYRPTIAALLGHEPEYVNVYMASEGMLGYESPEARDEFELFAGEMVFGFVPHEQYLEGDYSRRLRLDQLSAGVDYALLLTNGSGAFNYAIGDILTCTKSDGVPRFKLAGRMVLTLDVVAEKTSISAVG